jgi:aspartate/methionine/tyrosine aminotransferase
LQAAAAACVNDPDNIDRVREVRSRLRTTGNLFTAGLSGIDGITMPAGAPQGGFYLFADVSGYHENLPSSTPGESPGEHVANHLRSRRIHVGPGVGFGAAGRSYIRLAFTSPIDVLMEACERIAL